MYGGGYAYADVGLYGTFPSGKASKNIIENFPETSKLYFLNKFGSLLQNSLEPVVRAGAREHPSVSGNNPGDVVGVHVQMLLEMNHRVRRGLAEPENHEFLRSGGGGLVELVDQVVGSEEQLGGFTICLRIGGTWSGGSQQDAGSEYVAYHKERDLLDRIWEIPSRKIVHTDAVSCTTVVLVLSHPWSRDRFSQSSLPAGPASFHSSPPLR